LCLNAGVPATEVARRAGHGVAVMLKVYANCVDGEEPIMNARIEMALRSDRGTLDAPLPMRLRPSLRHMRDTKTAMILTEVAKSQVEGSHSGLVRRS
jgi:hypothetical protein